MKVLWRNQQVEEATWEAEEEMNKKYPHLFEYLCNRFYEIVAYELCVTCTVHVKGVPFR